MDLAGKRVVKRFRVAREGQTVDGRSLSREQLLDMADTYDPVEYTARINVEHMGGWAGLGATNYPVLGDVIAVDAQIETFEINGVDTQLMCLYATLSALPVLVDANREGKKLFTSIEFYPKFADTGRAYLVGLAVTDTPASRGTEPLKFTNTQDALIAEPTELVLMTIDNAANAPATSTATEPTALTTQPAAHEPQPVQDSDTFLQKLANLFNKKPSGLSAAEQDAVLSAFSKMDDKVSNHQSQLTEIAAAVQTLSQAVTDLRQEFANAPAPTTSVPLVGSGHALTDY
ncbi:GPO family capsid scaffolding protein [Moraxella atlantae]|uniref:Phage capsid scaffolding protein (GPO) serine peptidase n=1 Tax=Faucicola atlantae TaxID=34059 RepID=A0A378Q3F5_9GAMM|nr:GPO family capsid scaffolding protein [Moraxella atlantae]OPH35149.1 hypothetical protein B5J92_05725 [Moraxella atlantae]STY95046.1 Phage capsid scaffolding protein (GPO) serine peptidase [Moraxella atlantae]